MSRIGKKPISVPPGVDVRLVDGAIEVKGPKGALRREIHSRVKILLQDGGKTVRVEVTDPNVKRDRALWGLFRMLIANMITGVVSGFEKKLEVIGIGYKVAMAGPKLTLELGYSHPIDFPLPQGIAATVEKNVITVSGIDKEMVGEVAASIRRLRKPEPYKGKGIRYAGETIRRKAGKAAKTGAAAGGK
ncbi:50S ribosomal protein L6 [Candidatus Uhrbacteria bacterium RIFCSPHIGHO2_12_FULL_57_11]|uniref:Large ribosomal subunit protein uL6 n=1 Tax=Candidatus Uhrbacteria bacterium RIFCSPHIGHO2_12_FULL_57_11 TaxID=1802398 RepID=A0A1F7ULC0_9BACT|nr:MAG: 50S ribosomal protein L6 [Candidatus Uhrbacteria bacterium RIFCSPHIGHO2_12_FULL_57_11]